MVEFIQIKCYMYKIQVAGEENQYLLSKHNADDDTSYSCFLYTWHSESFPNILFSPQITCKPVIIIILTYRMKKYNIDKLWKLTSPTQWLLNFD